jgi:hypothetical protein
LPFRIECYHSIFASVKVVSRRKWNCSHDLMMVTVSQWESLIEQNRNLQMDDSNIGTVSWRSQIGCAWKWIDMEGIWIFFTFPWMLSIIVFELAARTCYMTFMQKAWHVTLLWFFLGSAASYSKLCRRSTHLNTRNSSVNRLSIHFQNSIALISTRNPCSLHKVRLEADSVNPCEPRREFVIFSWSRVLHISFYFLSVRIVILSSYLLHRRPLSPCPQFLLVLFHLHRNPCSLRVQVYKI